MKKLILTILFLYQIVGYAQDITYQGINFKTKVDTAIKVLNMATFHFGYTPDANTTEFDEHNKENIQQAHDIAKKIAEFKPTVIIVEQLPQYNKELKDAYNSYIKNPTKKYENPTEIELIAFEIGRLSNCKKIYGIDYKENYNYNIGNSIPSINDQSLLKWYYTNASVFDKKFMNTQPSLLDLFKLNNHPLYLDFLLNANADLLTHISSKDKHEGADEAAKYYHRNLVMYSNLNQISLTKEDRVFILMGGSHTAFFRDWLKRSPKFKLIDIYDYLK